MPVNTRLLSCSPGDVFAVVADGWLFPADSGSGVLIPPAILDMGLNRRNVETLRRLAYIAEGKRGNGEV